jgi:hypothetical protein
VATWVIGIGIYKKKLEKEQYKRSRERKTNNRRTGNNIIEAFYFYQAHSCQGCFCFLLLYRPDFNNPEI